MVSSGLPHQILLTRSACRRALWALKAGRAPREYVRFLTVGMDRVLEGVDAALERAASGEAVTPFVVCGDYGDGKSHTLHVIAEAARATGFVWVLVTHDRQQSIGLHKPAWFLRRVLWEVRWGYPDIDLSRWFYPMHGIPDYRSDREMRSRLAAKLGALAADLRAQGWRGLVVCVDELENFSLLAANQKPIFREVLGHLRSELQPGVVLVFALTPTRAALQTTSQEVVPAPLDEGVAREVADRIRQLHSVAFAWQPVTSAGELAEQGLRHARSLPSGQWRSFVQYVVTLLEVEHQSVRRGDTLPAAAPVPAQHDESVPASGALPLPVDGRENRAVEIRPASAQPLTAGGVGGGGERQESYRPKIVRSMSRLIVPGSRASRVRPLRVGDRVEIIGGRFLGWTARIVAIDGERARVELEGRLPACVELRLVQLQRAKH